MSDNAELLKQFYKRESVRLQKQRPDVSSTPASIHALRDLDEQIFVYDFLVRTNQDEFREDYYKCERLITQRLRDVPTSRLNAELLEKRARRLQAETEAKVDEINARLHWQPKKETEPLKTDLLQTENATQLGITTNDNKLRMATASLVDDTDKVVYRNCWRFTITFLDSSYLSTHTNTEYIERVERIFREKFGAIYFKFFPTGQTAVDLFVLLTDDPAGLLTRSQVDQFSRRFVDKWREMYPYERVIDAGSVPIFRDTDQLSAHLIHVHRAMSDENADLREQLYTLEHEKLQLSRKVDDMKLKLQHRRAEVEAAAKVEEITVRLQRAGAAKDAANQEVEAQKKEVERFRKENAAAQQRVIELGEQITKVKNDNIGFKAANSGMKKQLEANSLANAHSTQIH
jgi:hypothetical protein